MTRNFLSNPAMAALILLSLSIYQLSIAQIHGQLVAEEASKLRRCGQFDIQNAEIIAVAYDVKRIYVASDDGIVRAIDPATMSTEWTTDIGGAIVSNLVIADSRVIVAGSSKPTNGEKPDLAVLRALNADTGLIAWNSPIPFSERIYLGNPGQYLISVTREGAMIATGLTSGNQIWNTHIPANISTVPDLNFDRIVFGTEQKEILSVNAINGKLLRRSPTKFVPASVRNYSERSIAYGDDRGNLHFVESSSGKTIWKYKSGGKISHVANTAEGILLISNDNFAYMLWDYNGDVLWKRRLPGRAAGPSLVSGDTIAIQLSGEKSAFVLNLRNGNIINQLNLADVNSSGIEPGLFGNGRVVFATRASVTLFSVKPCSI